MVQTQFADLTGGYEKFDALRKDLEGIFDQIYQMKDYKLDIGYYEGKFAAFKRDFKLGDDALKSGVKMPFETMQKEFEDNTLAPCNKALEALIMEFEENVTPIYNIYRYFTDIEKKIKSNEEVDDVVAQTILLIDQINGIYTHNKIEVTKLFDKAYEVIYMSLLYEKVYNRNDILEYLRRKNLSTNRENLGKIVREKTKLLLKTGQLSESQVDEEFFKHIDEGLGYDYLSDEFLATLSRIELEKKYASIQEAKMQVRSDIVERIKEHNSKYLSAVDDMQKANKSFSIARKARSLAVAMACGVIFFPFIIGGTGALIGKVASDKIDLYATTTRSINMDTGEVIGEPEVIYDERETSYVATIVVFDPWRKNPNGVGYVRNAIAYEYAVPDDIEEGYHVTKEDIEGHLREKYRYLQAKDNLLETDSMTDAEIIVTETFQDKLDTHKSKKYIVPFALIGFFLSAILEGIFLYRNCFEPEDFTSSINEETKKLNRERAKRKDAVGNLKRIKKGIESLKEEKAKLEKEYGISVDEEILSDNDKKGLRH